MNLPPTFSEHLAKEFAKQLGSVYSLFLDKKPAACPPGLDSALLFTALERCRTQIAAAAEIDPKDIWCRYTLRRFVSEECELHVRETINSIRTLNPEMESPCESMKEFLFDFSLTTMRRDTLASDEEPGAGKYFEFILIAESEIHGDREVLIDLPRLIAANSPVKVMLYSLGGANTCGVIARTLRRCARTGLHTKEPWCANWIFFGVQRYSEWSNSEADNVQGCIHTLSAQTDQFELTPHQEWWPATGA